MPLTATHPRASARSDAASAPLHEPVLLRAEGLKKAFGGQVVLNGLNLELRQGEVVLLRGENGSGKTTLLNILTGNLAPDAGTIHYLADTTPRSYRFPRRWWQELNPFDHFTPEFVTREGVGRTWQEIRLFGAQTLRDNVAVAEPGHPGENPVLALVAPSLIARRETELNCEADTLLAGLGLAGREDSSADKISLGQSKRVAIARAIAAGARILFLDEPLAGLDRQGVNDVLELLETLIREQRVTLVIIEHVFNQPHLHGLVTTDWLLDNGKIQRPDGNGAGDDSVRARSLGSSGLTIQRPAWFELLAGEGAEVVDEPLPWGALLTRIRRPGHFENPPKPVLEIRDLVVRRGARVVIGLDEHANQTGFSLTLCKGDKAVLQAPNGWGKSTLFEAISGFLPAESGEIRLSGSRVDRLPAWRRFRKGLRSLPSARNTFPGLTLRESLRLADMSSRVVSMAPLAERTTDSLSGGERQRLAIASVAAGEVTLYDEPFVALDAGSLAAIFRSGWIPSSPTSLLFTPIAGVG
jgi:ABC-type branched-subunit amino acid transport system ATPase component